MRKLMLAAIGLAATTALAAPAFAQNIDASTSGWIAADGSSDNTGFNSGFIANHYVGVEEFPYRNFFSFSLPPEKYLFRRSPYLE